MGHRSAAAYAADAAEHARFMRAVDPSLKFVAVGKTDDRHGWTETVLGAVGNQIDYLSFHLYGATTQLVDGAAEYEAIVAQSLYFEQQIAEYSDLVERFAGDRPLALSLDEWNIRHVEPAAWPDPQPSADGGTVARDVDGLPTAPAHRVNRWSPRTLADALFYAGVFHALHRAGGRQVPVAMANTVNLLNANGVIVARPGGAVRAATYHVWDLYQNHLGPVALSADVRSPGRLTAVRQGDERDRRGEPEDPLVGSRRGDVLLLHELDPIGDQLRPPVEPTGIHGAEAALHVGHHLVLGLAHQQREDEEGRQHADGAQGHLDGVVHRGPHSGSGTPGAETRRRPVGLACSDSPGSLAPGHGLEARAARTNDLRSGVPSKPSGRRSGRSPSPVPSSKPSKSRPNISWVSRSCQATPRNTGVRLANDIAAGTRVRISLRRNAVGVEPSIRWQTTSSPGACSSSAWSTAVSQSKKV